MLKKRASGRALAVAALPIVIPAVGCEDRNAVGPATPPPTYSEDVAAILADDCASCHRPGGIGPFPLITYEDAAPRADAIAKVTRERIMPPFNLDNSGTCNTYAEARWLDDAEISTLEAWAKAGAPRGDPSAPPVRPPPPRELDRVDLTVDMGTPYTPSSAEDDDYRCFILDPGLERDQFLVGAQIHPGQARMVHHLTLFAFDTQEAEDMAANIDAAEEGPGFECFGDTRAPSRWLVGSGPGGGAILLPEGTGLRMRAGRKTLLQMHYNRANGTFPDRTRIDLKLASSVPREAFVVRLADTDLRLPPGKREVNETASLVIPEPVTIWGVWPHMHTLGTRLRAVASRDGGEQCLAQVNRWDFHWQGFAHYDSPIHVEEGDTMTITCTYDTTSRKEATTWGHGTKDEMCIAFLYMTQDR